MTAQVLTRHLLTDDEQHAICCVLHSLHIDVACEVVAGVTVIRPLKPCTTTEEVTALRAFAAVTDGPLRWHDTRINPTGGLT